MARNKIVVILLIVFVLLSLLTYFYNYPYNIDYQLIGTININYDQYENAGMSWMTIIDSKFHPFWDEGYLFNRFNIDINKFQLIDKTENSYIITFGHKLEKLYISANSPGTEKYAGIIPKQYNGVVKLSDKKDQNIYIYKIKKINIVNNIKFEDEIKSKYSYLYNK